jgi:hypothetical protein
MVWHFGDILLKDIGIFLIIKNNYEGKLYFYDNMVEISLLKSDGTRSVHDGVKYH